MDGTFEKADNFSTTMNGNEQNLPEVDGTDNKSNDSERWKCVKSCSRSVHKFRTDVIYQDKVVYSSCIFTTFFIIGWGKGQFGPAYIDLRFISNTDLEQGSWILTSFFVGYSIGSVLQGFLHDRVNRKLMYSVCLFIWSIVIAGIPWCSLFEAMLSGYIMIGSLQGILDTGGNTEILRIWQKKGREAILRLNLVFALGSVLAPLVVAPFLMDQPRDENILTRTTNGSYLTEVIQNISNTSRDHQFSYAMKIETYRINNSLSTSSRRINMNMLNRSYLTKGRVNMSDLNFLESLFESKSGIYVPFSISAGLSLIACIMFLISYVCYSTEKIRPAKKACKTRKARKLPTTIKYTTISVIGFLFFCYCGIDEAYTAFLSTFCVEQFHWSKQQGAFLTSLVFICILVARLLTVIFEKWIDTLVIIGINFIIMFISILGLLIVSLYNFDTALWLFSPLYGFAKSCLFALLFSWSNEYIAPMTGKISAFYFVAATLGCALNPVLLGVLMENDAVWYCYLFLIEIIIVVVLYLLGLLITKYIVRNYGKTYDAEPDIVKVGYTEDEDFLDEKAKEEFENSN
ncbi:sodium-dependent glucose transporter 1B-like [Ylistrum balloti]|uniref:sodium-dependent glucose transporter 1B-like n=1 Tax=Ylistrum balloti TaxID=509963 RepID=UPI002905A521|nr:sodium-dependent glucose transporter 1B-like [Ylistrum balloti]